jgi:CTP synthase
VKAAQYCREKKIPYFGICLGMQALVTEFARNACGLKDANSTEINLESPHPVISLLNEQKEVTDMGGTMRLGAYPCKLAPGSKAHKAYGQDIISERHRHRYEFNSSYKAPLEEKGLLLSGILDNGKLCEISEVVDHPWMVGVQFHPEFKSRPTEAHPLFHDFVEAAILYSQENK